MQKKFIQYMSQILTRKCNLCGKDHIDAVINYYLGEKPICISCHSISMIFWPLITFFFHQLRFSKKDAMKFLNDPLLNKTILNLIRGIGYFGVKNPQPTRVPVVIVWNITNRCNLKCLHCHQSSTFSLQSREVTTKQTFQIIEQLADAGVSIITFSGGEPLLRSDIFDIITKASDMGIYCTIASNGIPMRPAIVKKLRHAGIKRVEIGLDGSNPETHDFLRNRQGCFQQAVEGIKNCAIYGNFEEIAVTATLYSSNATEIPHIVDLAESLGATRFYLNRLIPAGRGVDIPHLDISKKDKLNILTFLSERFQKSVLTNTGIQCYARGMTYLSRIGYQQSQGQIFHVSEAFSGYDPMFKKKFGTELSKIVRKFSKGFSGCSAGLTYCGLSAEGNVLPCVPAPISLGNLLEKNIEEIWAENQILHQMRNRKNLQGGCGNCEYNGLCGGCRYTAYYYTNDWLGTDSSCPFSSSE